MKDKVYSLNFLFINFIKSTKIGKRVFNSENLLPGKREIIFFPFEIFDISIFESYFSNKGWPTKVFLIFSLSKNFFSKSNNNKK